MLRGAASFGAAGYAAGETGAIERHPSQRSGRRANESRVVLAERGELTMVLPKSHVIVSTVLQLVAAGILLQTLFFKFTGAAESVYIFTTLGMEPWGRIGSGVAELVAAALLLYPPTAAIGG